MKRLFVALYILLTLNLAAQPGKTPFKCLNDANVFSKYFPEIQQKARLINSAICNTLQDSMIGQIIFNSNNLDDFAFLVKSAVNKKFAHIALQNLQNQLDYFERELKGGEKFPVFNMFKGTDPRKPQRRYYFSGWQDSAIIITAKNDSVCSAEFGVSCSELLDDLKIAIEPYQMNQNSYTAYKANINIQALQREWTDYFNHSKSQTFADIILTTLIEKNIADDDFLTSPPARQWFFLHPGVAYEYMEEASDGSEISEAFYFEWLGVNWLFDTPLGLSLTSSYAGLAGAKNSGHGFILTYNNSYMLGYVQHKDKYGFLLSVDVLKAFEDNKQAIGSFNKRLQGLLGN